MMLFLVTVFFFFGAGGVGSAVVSVFWRLFLPFLLSGFAGGSSSESESSSCGAVSEVSSSLSSGGSADSPSSSLIPAITALVTLVILSSGSSRSGSDQLLPVEILGVDLGQSRISFNSFAALTMSFLFIPFSHLSFFRFRIFNLIIPVA